MDPDSDSPVSRMERTFWTVWYYLTGAVSRVLRSEPTNVSGDPNSFQESAADSEPADNGHTQGDINRGEIDMEQPLAEASLLSSSGAVVAWELCKTKNSDLKEDEECTEHKTQLSGGSESKASEEGESTREGRFSQTENDDAGLLSPKDTRAETAEEEENAHQKVYTHRQVESLENVEYEEKFKTGSLTPTDDGMSEITEEDTQRTMTPDDPKKTDESIELGKEGNKIHPEHEQVLEEEDDIEIKLCTITDSGLEEEDNMHMNEAKVQSEDTATALTHEEAEISSGVLQLVSECENKSDEGEKPESQISICERWSVSDTGVKLDTVKEKMMAPESESDKSEDEQEEEEESMLHEREQCEEGIMSEAENKQTTDNEQEEEEDIKSVRDDSQEKYILTKCDARSIDNLQNAETQSKVSEELVSTREGRFSQTENDDAGLLSPKDTRAETAEEEENAHQKVYTHRQVESLENVDYEEKLKTGSLTPTDDGMSEITEEDTQRTMTPADPKKTDESIELGKEGNKIHPEHEQVLEEEDDIETKLCTITDSGLEEEDNMHMDEAKVQSEDEEEDESMLHEKEQWEEGIMSEAENNQTIDNEQEEEEDIKSVRDDSQEKYILTKCDACSIDNLQNAETQSKVSEELVSTREGRFSQTENDDAGLLSPKDTRAETAEEEENAHQKVYTHRQVESLENVDYEEKLKTGSLTPTDDGMSEITEEDTQRTMTPADPKKTDESIELGKEGNKIHPEHEQVLEEEDDIETKLCTITDSGLEEEDNMHMDEAKVQSEDEEEDESMLHEREQCEEGIMSEAENNQIIDNEQEEEEDIKSVRDDSQEKYILTKCDARSIDNLQNAETQSKVSEKLVSTREGRFSQTENDDAGLLSPKDTRAETAEEEENAHQKVYTHRQVESLENVEYEEKFKTGSLTPTDDGMSEITEEDTQRTMTPDDPKKTDESIELGEEGNKIHPEHEQVLEEEDDIEIKLCTITDSGLEEEKDNMHMNEAKVQSEDTATTLVHEEAEISSGVLQLVSECENKSDEGEKPESQISICERWSVSDTGVKLDTVKEKMMAPESESDKSEDEQEEEDKNMLHEREQCEEGIMSEAENKQTTDNEQEEEEDIKSVRDDSQEKYILTKCDARSIDNLQNAETQSKVSEKLVSTRKGRFSQTENDDAGLLSPKDTRAETAEEEENAHQKVYTHRQVESLENVDYEEKFKTGSLTPTDDGMSEITEEDTQRTMTPDDPKKTDESIELGEEGNKIHPEHEQVLEEEDDIETKLCTITDSGLEEEDNMHMDEAKVQSEDTATALTHEEAEISSGVLQLVSECENKSDEGEKPESQISICERWSVSDTGVKLDTVKEKMMAPESESDKSEDEQEEEEESMLHEREQCEEGIMSEAENKQTIDNEQEEEEDIKSVRDDSQEKYILTKCDAHSIDNLQNAETELHTAEFPYEEEEEDVAMNSQMQIKTRETDDVCAAVEVSVNETFFDKDHVEEERPLMKTAFTHISSTLEPEAETGLKISGDFKNISSRMCEGEVVVSEELNSATCGETQKGFPENNNEPGQYENSTQRFLEVVDCMEIQTTQLPEEEGSQESESLQNSGLNYLLVDEHRIKEQESTEDNNKEHAGILYHTHSGLPQETETPLFDQVIEESGDLFLEKEGNLLVHSMKIEHSQKELGTCVGLTDESDETTAQQQDGTEDMLDEFETDEGFSDLKDALGHGRETTGAVPAEEAMKFTEESSNVIGAEETKMADTSFFQESVDTINLDQHCTVATSLLEDITESGLLKQSIETKPKTTEDCTVDVHDVVIHSKETGYGLEEEAAGNEMQNNNQMEISNLQLLSQIEGKDQNESALFAGSEVDEEFEISNKETVTDTEAADELLTDEFKQKDAAIISPEEMVIDVTELERNCAKEESSSISGNQDVIEEEILDLWIQAASSENTDMNQQEGPQQIDAEIEQSNEEQSEISSVQTETEKEQHVKSNSGESGFVSNTELSSLTAESGFLNQSVCVWDTQHCATQPIKLAATESFQDIYDILDSISESTGISDLSTQQFKFQSQDILIEEAGATGQSHLKEEESLTETGFHPDSVVMSSEARQDKCDGEQVKLVETETEKATEAEKTDPASKTDIEDSDFTSPKEVEETNFGDEAFEVTASRSPNEFKPTQSGQYKSPLEVLSEEGILSMESGLQVNTETEKLFPLPSFKKPQPEWSEDSAESLPEQNRTQVADQVDSSALDFTAQRSRIAVKNRRVRPPKDARSLLHMPSVEPTPSSNLPVKVPAGVPLRGLGIGIKLPGLGAGFPVLKKTQRVGREENSSETPKQQEPETKPEDKGDSPKQDEAQHKPKWMPPKQIGIGFGNPLMSELKTKLKKPTKE